LTAISDLRIAVDEDHRPQIDLLLLPAGDANAV
jgi:hypothetical protein